MQGASVSSSLFHDNALGAPRRPFAHRPHIYSVLGLLCGAICVCVCVCACVHACISLCMCVCVCVCVQRSCASKTVNSDLCLTTKKTSLREGRQRRVCEYEKPNAD